MPEIRARAERAAVPGVRRLRTFRRDLPAVRISRRELFAFSVATKVIEAFHGTPLETDMRAVMEKIHDSMQGKITIDPVAFTEELMVWGEDYVRIDPDTWTQMARSLDRRERVGIRCQRFHGVLRNYQIDPYHLLAYHGNWYVLAGRSRRARPSMFALSRIHSIRPAGTYFERPKGLNIRDHFRHAFGLASSGEVMQVRLHIRKTIATYIGERVWHPSQQIKKLEGGDLEMTFETDGWKELVRWILSWQPDVQVLEPERLRLRIAEKLMEGVRRIVKE